MTPRTPCPRCGRPRAVKPDRAAPPDNPHRLCGDCRQVEPGWPTDLIAPAADDRATPKPFIDPDDLLDGLIDVSKLLAAHADALGAHRVRRAAAEARVTCTECGCLCFADEPCPNCRKAVSCTDRYRLATTSLVQLALNRSTLDGGK